MSSNFTLGEEDESVLQNPQSSPLLSHFKENEDDSSANEVNQFENGDIRKSKQTSLFMVLAVGLGGSLGLSKSQTAITFIAGPFCGIFVQPCFGFWSDHCKSTWGKRRPFIAFGGCALVGCLLGLAWTTSIVDLFLSHDGDLRQDTENKREIKEFVTTILAVIFTFGVYFSSQPVQGGLRALVVDVCAIDKQHKVNALISLVSGLANILGYLWAVLDLSQYVSYFGNTQFKNLSILASLSLTISLAFCCIFVTEQNVRAKTPTRANKKKISKTFGSKFLKQAEQTFRELARMPRQIINICMVQFFSWMGWYPYLLYVSTYLSDIYTAEIKVKSSSRAGRMYDADWEYATRIGPLALLISSVVSVVAAISLPSLLRPLDHESGGSRKRPSRSLLNRIKSLRPSLIHIWMFSHLLFAICMFGTLFVSSVAGTVTIFGFVGISWAVATWIPYTLLSMEISRASEEDGVSKQFPTSSVLSLHNVAICIPQILISIGSSLYWKLQDEDMNNPTSTGFVLRIGGFASLLALWMTTHVLDPGIDGEAAANYMQLDYEMTVVNPDDVP